MLWKYLRRENDVWAIRHVGEQVVVRSQEGEERSLSTSSTHASVTDSRFHLFLLLRDSKLKMGGRRLKRSASRSTSRESISSSSSKVHSLPRSKLSLLHLDLQSSLLSSRRSLSSKRNKDLRSDSSPFPGRKNDLDVLSLLETVSSKLDILGVGVVGRLDVKRTERKNRSRSNKDGDSVERHVGLLDPSRSDNGDRGIPERGPLSGGDVVLDLGVVEAEEKQKRRVESAIRVEDEREREIELTQER